jgi:hypothetical protein
VLALGVVALAVPKKERLSYLVVETVDGELIVEVRSRSALELRAALQPLGTLLANSADEGAQSQGSGHSRQRLLELKALYEEGLITEAEYSERRVQIVNEL